MTKLIKEVLSNGYVLGRIKKLKFNNESENTADYSSEIEKLDKAISLSLSQINKLINENSDLIEFLEPQLYMISDKVMYKALIELIDNGNSAVLAINTIFDDYINQLSSTMSDYLKQRISDFNDCRMRLINNIRKSLKPSKRQKYILLADRIYPTELIENRESIIGVIAREDGDMSHAAILCRLWDIPYILTDLELEDDEEVIIDTRKQIIISNPSIIEINDYYDEINYDNDLKAVKHNDVLFLANVGSNLDLDRVNKYDFDGVGLYRTEFIFMNSDKPYSFIQQYEIYKEAVSKMNGKSIVFRTFDIDYDKVIPYMNVCRKSVDNYKNNPEIFESQISALLKANTDGNLKIMFPMIETNEEFLFLKRWVLDIKNKHGYDDVKIGLMLETKKAFESYKEFTSADFISIGTNDLSFELYNIDRLELLKRLDEYLPDLINKISDILSFMNELDISVSVCGEIASVGEIALKLFDIGIKNLSVSPQAINMLNFAYRNKNE